MTQSKKEEAVLFLLPLKKTYFTVTTCRSIIPADLSVFCLVAVSAAWAASKLDFTQILTPLFKTHTAFWTTKPYMAKCRRLRLLRWLCIPHFCAANRTKAVIFLQLMATISAKHLFLFTEVSLKKTFECFSVSCFIFSHFMNCVMDCVEV